MAGFDVSRYSHSPVHKAVLTRDYRALKHVLVSLPRLCDPSEIRTEEDSIAEERKSDTISSMIDRRDVPNRETPLHLAVKLADPTSAEMLVFAGADWSLQNEQGWSALQEAICSREENIAKIIVRNYQPLAWAKWCRRLPRVVGTMRRMRDFYMEIKFHFESSVIPFISRIAPSDTYKIWKQGSNLRADMTLAGFDGFRIQRSDQSILFLGDGSEDGKIPPGSLCMVSHKDKEIMNALDGAGTPATEEEIEQEVQAMSKTNIFRPGIDVTQAVLLPQMTWRRHDKSEMVGSWKTKVYDMHHVVVSVRSRRVPGAMTDNELFSSHSENDTECEVYNDILTEEEKRQLEHALNMGSSGLLDEDYSDGNHSGCCDQNDIPVENVNICSSSTNTCSNSEAKHDKKGWLGNWSKRGHSHKSQGHKKLAPRNSLHVESKVGNLLEESHTRSQNKMGRHSVDGAVRGEDNKRGREKDVRKPVATTDNAHSHKESSRESEYKKGLRPVLWLSPSFPLQTEEFLPLLDIIADKVKAIRRLRELLTTKLPAGTFPVKVAIPVVPTIRVLVTFTKFEELQPTEEFKTPPSSPEKENENSQPTRSWLQWIKDPYGQSHSAGPSSCIEEIQDPFDIPQDYTWITKEAKKKKVQENKKSKKGKSHKI